MGKHLIKQWSRTQPGIALSSGEAELYALVKASTETLGMVNLCKELGYAMQGVVATDSSAAKSIATRSGSGRLKHIELNQLWIQEQASKQTLRYIKIPREANISGLMTHHWQAAHGENLMRLANLVNPDI